MREQSRRFSFAMKKAGQLPGALTYAGLEEARATNVRVMDFGPQHFEEGAVTDLNDLKRLRDRESVTWIDLHGLRDVPKLAAIGDIFGIHQLVLEDMLNTFQRPKAEFYEDLIFVVVKMIRFDAEKDLLVIEQVSLAWGKGFLLTAQELSEDVFDAIRERLRKGTGRMRSQGPDFLAYAILDAVVDRYLKVIEQIGEIVEDLELRVFHDSDKELLGEVFILKRQLLELRRALWPLRDEVSLLIREEEDTNLIQDSTLPYLRDLYDHTIQVIDAIEMFRDSTAGLMDMHFSVMSTRMNQVMKVLAIFSSIFIPLTFLAGVYGMNFQHMPELAQEWAYPAIWVVFALTGGGLLYFFKRLGWFR